MLIDVTLFVDVKYLVIGECDRLIAVSMLGKLKHLELIDCVSIETAKGLEGVRELIIEGCKQLEDVNNTSHRPWSVLEQDLMR